MKIHAKFPTVIRGHECTAELSGHIGEGGRIDLTVDLIRDGQPWELDLTREELAALCRAASRATPKPS